MRQTQKKTRIRFVLGHLIYHRTLICPRPAHLPSHYVYKKNRPQHSRYTHWTQKSPRIVPIADSEGFVAPSILRPSSTTFTPTHTMHTTGPDDCTQGNVAHMAARGRSVSWHVEVVGWKKCRNMWVSFFKKRARKPYNYFQKCEQEGSFMKPRSPGPRWPLPLLLCL